MKTILLYILFLTSAFAHPHTFIEVYPTINVKDSKFSTVNFKWVLDEMTSTILIMELDSNANGKIDENENKYIEEEYFSMFETYNYYTHIKQNSKNIKQIKPKNFKATIENNRLCYSFDIDGDFDIKNTVFEFGDSDYYVAMVLKQEFVSVNGAVSKISSVDNELYYGYKLELK